MTRAISAVLTAGPVLLLGACASDTTNYPSLARRDVERAAAAPAPAATATPAPDVLDPAIAARLPAMVANARDAHRRFAAARDRAERTIATAAGSTPGSEAWAQASIALASLESARSQAMIALADLDSLHAEARVNGTGGAGSIAAARDEVAALVREEDAVLDALRSRLGD